MKRTVATILAMAMLMGCVAPHHSRRPIFVNTSPPPPTAAAGAAPGAAIPTAPAQPGGKALAPLPVPLVGAYDANNPFARIIRGEAAAAKVYEDAHVLAFMDIAPVERGHVLVISKTSHARNLLEIDDADLTRLMKVVRRIGRAEMAAFGAEGFSIEQNNAYGQTVGQFHIHVMPRYRGQPWGEKSGPRQTPAQLEPDAARIREALANLR